MLRKGSASTGLCESPRVPSERYEPRPCLCVFVACFDRRIFYYSSKTDSWWGCVAKVTASNLLMARPRHCLSATHGWPSLNNSQCSSPTLYTHTVSCTAGGKQAARGREGARESRRWEGRREQGAGGREGGSDDVRQGRGEEE